MLLFIGMNPERRSLYPERASSNITEQVEALQNIIEGREPTWEVSAEEREAILQLEQELGTKLEAIRAITPRSFSINLQYFLTPDGAADFQSTTGLEIPHTTSSPDELKQFLYEHTQQLVDTPQKALTPMSGRSTKFKEHERVAHLTAGMEADGSIDTSHLPETSSQAIRLTPELDVEKTTKLRELKADIKAARAELTAGTESEDYTEMLDGIYQLYLGKINEIIAERVNTFAAISKKADFMGVDSLTDTEQAAASLDTVSSNSEANLGRYDKFLRGSSGEFDEQGWHKQVGAELTALADQQEKVYIESILHKGDMIKQKGLSPEKIAAGNISPEEVRRYCEETLAHYGLLSEVDPSEYVPNRPGPAADGKWQVIVKDSYQSLSVQGKQRVIKCPNKPQSIDKLIGVSLAHETEGHVLQHTNRSQIPLQLFDKIGSNRSGHIAEAGALRNENRAKEDAFGFNKLTHPHYVRAMVRKHEGGNYADCLASYYESAIKAHRILLENESINEVEFHQACIIELTEAVNRTSRLFRNGADAEGSNPHIAETKATEYLEQNELKDKLQAAGLDAVLNLTGVNLEAVHFLLKAKLLDLDKIQSPDFYSLQIWDRLKENYRPD